MLNIRRIVMSAPLEHRTVAIGDCSLHVVSAGPTAGKPIVFLHGWPEDWSAWSGVLDLAAREFRVFAVDLPGIGGSEILEPRGDKKYLAGLLHELLSTLDLTDVTLVGHDCGGMVAYAYVREFSNLSGVVIMDTVIPGISPWDKVIANPFIWHFAFHALPRLPETLVTGHEAEYFDCFFDWGAADPTRITAEARARYVAAYNGAALRQGFEFYRAFRQDALDNKAGQNAAVATPVLYLRGEREGGTINEYVDGFRAAGLTNVSQGLIPNCGHFCPEEAPSEVWNAIHAFMSATR
jgi:pimeloyl-ACP methyl ester carboxylesterase